MLISWGAPSAGQGAGWLAAATADEPTYREIGATASDEMPAGYRHDEYSTDLGRGDDVLARARHGLETWRAHTGAGLAVHPPDAPLEVGTTLLVVAPAGPLRVSVPCRIVSVVDEPGRFGFAYGTLPGHPEQGEESFVCETGADGVVRFHIRAFSRPHDPLARLGAPISRFIQVRTTRAYLRAMESFVRTAG